MEIFEHLKTGNVVKLSRIEKTNIDYFDYYDDRISGPEEINDNRSIRLLCQIPPDVRQRLLIVEDLSENTICALGSFFGVSPEFFEEYLLNSGYGEARYNEPPARTWKTSRLKKSHASIKWYRPVHRLPTLFSNRDRKDSLEGSLEYAVAGSRISFKAETSIFRSEWDLWKDPTATARMRRQCGLEERASIWRQRLPDRDCQIGKYQGIPMESYLLSSS